MRELSIPTIIIAKRTYAVKATAIIPRITRTKAVKAIIKAPMIVRIIWAVIVPIITGRFHAINTTVTTNRCFCHSIRWKNAPSITRWVAIQSFKSKIFQSIDKSSDQHKRKKRHPFSSATCSQKHQAEYEKLKQMTPSKFYYFFNPLHGGLDFMNGRYLHSLASLIIQKNNTIKGAI